MKKSVTLAAIMLAFTSATALPAASATAQQRVSDDELQKFIYQRRFPVSCESAMSAVSKMRANPTTDPVTLRQMITSFVQCAKGPWAANNGALFNSAMFAASAASLLSARHEGSSDASSDARNAAHGAQLIVDYTHGVPAGRSAGSTNNQFAPSPFITDAGRIKRDAMSLIAATAQGRSRNFNYEFPATPSPGRGSL